MKDSKSLLIHSPLNDSRIVTNPTCMLRSEMHTVNKKKHSSESLSNPLLSGIPS